LLKYLRDLKAVDCKGFSNINLWILDKEGLYNFIMGGAQYVQFKQ